MIDYTARKLSDLLVGGALLQRIASTEWHKKERENVA